MQHINIWIAVVRFHSSLHCAAVERHWSSINTISSSDLPHIRFISRAFLATEFKKRIKPKGDFSLKTHSCFSPSGSSRSLRRHQTGLAAGSCRSKHRLFSSYLSPMYIVPPLPRNRWIYFLLENGLYYTENITCPKPVFLSERSLVLYTTKKNLYRIIIVIPLYLYVELKEHCIQVYNLIKQIGGRVLLFCSMLLLSFGCCFSAILNKTFIQFTY